jgi:HSP20 family protein
MLGELQLWFQGWPSVERFRRDMDELFERFFGEGFRTSTNWMSPWAVPESYFKDGKWVMRFDLPGVDPKAIDISVAGDTLTIRALRERRNEGQYHEAGKSEGSYSRLEHSLTLPKGV